jgi:hypothetical protein
MSIQIWRPEVMPAGEIIDVVLTCVNRGVIKGRYRKIWQTENNGRISAGFRCVSMEEDSLRLLHEWICRDCMIQERREFT